MKAVLYIVILKYSLYSKLSCCIRFIQLEKKGEGKCLKRKAKPLVTTCHRNREKRLHPLHPNTSMHILLTVLYTFPKVLTRRICFTIKENLYDQELLQSVSISLILEILMFKYGEIF